MSAVVSPNAVDDEMELWRRFAGASEGDLLPLWFALLCRQIGEVISALVLMPGESNSMEPATVWPNATVADMPSLLEVARESLSKRRGVVQRLDTAGQMIQTNS